MIRDLRKENADRRVKAKPYDEAFGEYNAQEQELLLGIVRTLAHDQAAGGKALRDLAVDILGEDGFREGLEFLENAEEVPAKAEDETTEDEEKEGQVPTGLSAEELKAELDRREKAREEAEAKAKQDAEVAEIFAEIEALGFEQGSEGFMTMLSLANTQATLGKDPDFKVLAPQVRSLVGLPEPEAEGEPTKDEAAPEAKPEVKFPSTADAGGAGAATEAPKDWVAEAKAAGKSPMEAARERLEARLSQA